MNKILEMKKVGKIYPGVKALNNINIEFNQSEIHAIVGENGAGKSTLCNVITGLVALDEGEFFWEGEKVISHSPAKALKQGIRMVYQERNLIPSMTAAENIFLGDDFVKNTFFLDKQKTLKEARSLIKSLDIDIDLSIPAYLLSPGERQMIEIVRAIRKKAKLLILDEPSSSITEKDVVKLFDILKKIKTDGTSIIFISHKLGEVFSISDRISIFRDGEMIHSDLKENLDEKTCIKHMINRELNNLYPEHIDTKSDKVILSTNGISDRKKINKINFKINSGEVVGFYGLIGAGRTEFAEILFGLESFNEDKIYFKNNKINLNNTKKAIDNGIILTPEDRHEHGLFFIYDIKKNFTLPYLSERLKYFFGFIKRKYENILALNLAEKISLNYSSLNQNIGNLSGGNKQKVVLGKWLLVENMNLVIMDEPTQGIDVGTKYEIYVLIRELAKDGKAVIFISSEMPELLGVCDRIDIFKDGMITKSIARKDFNKEEILSSAI